MAQRKLTVETYWTADTRRHHTPKTLLRLKGHWLKEAGFNAHAAAAVTVRPGCLTITTGDQTMPNHSPTLAELCAQVRAAINAYIDANPHNIDPDRLAIRTAQDVAPTDARALLLLAALDDNTLAERRPTHYWTDEPLDHIRANVIDRLWEEATAAIFD